MAFTYLLHLLSNPAQSVNRLCNEAAASASTVYALMTLSLHCLGLEAIKRLPAYHRALP